MLRLCHRLRLCDNARLNDLASSYRQDHGAVGAFGWITNSPALAAPVSFRCSGFTTTLALTTLPPLIVKTRTLSEAFGVITISPALAAPTVTNSAATTAANDFISGLSIKF